MFPGDIPCVSGIEIMIASIRLKYAAQFVPLFLVSATMPAQQTPTSSTDVKVVNVLAKIRDNHGDIVNPGRVVQPVQLGLYTGPQERRYFPVSSHICVYQPKGSQGAVPGGCYPSHPIDTKAS